MNSDSVYPNLSFPDPPVGRPYVFMNMVTTIDGKTTSGTRTEPVQDLGSAMDHATMRDIEAAADAVMIGAGSLRATEAIWYPPQLARFVVTGSGNLDPNVKFFTDAPGQVFVVTHKAGEKTLSPSLVGIVAGDFDIDFGKVLATMRSDLGIKRLLVEGGAELNASLLSCDLVDELFCTISPKVKLGRETPTYADGEPLQRGSLLQFELVSVTRRGDELFLRYRRTRAGH